MRACRLDRFCVSVCVCVCLCVLGMPWGDVCVCVCVCVRACPGAKPGKQARSLASHFPLQTLGAWGALAERGWER